MVEWMVSQTRVWHVDTGRPWQIWVISVSHRSAGTACGHFVCFDLSGGRTSWLWNICMLEPGKTASTRSVTVVVTKCRRRKLNWWDWPNLLCEGSGRCTSSWELFRSCAWLTCPDALHCFRMLWIAIDQVDLWPTEATAATLPQLPWGASQRVPRHAAGCCL